MTTIACAREPRHSVQDAHSSAWRGVLARLVAAWKAWLEASDERWTDRRYARERNAHERFLQQARDHFELERLERDWERGQAQSWRVY